MSPRSWLFPLLAVAGAGLCFALTYCAWDWLTADGMEIRSIVLRNSILVAAALVTIVLTIWRSLVTEQQLKTAQRQSEIAQRSHLEGRYQDAAELLGSNLLSVRLGGIHALDQLARDYPNEFHIQVMRLFAAFLRHPPAYGDPLSSDGSDGGTKMPPSRREDIQIIMVSLAGRTVEGRELERAGKYILDLSGADLNKVWFPSNACLERVRLSGARLIGIRGLTQRQLAQATADPGDLPILDDAYDSESGQQLFWGRH
ncbi:MAG: hypothetical protein OXN96_15565 [Bryobacterales bacterium]|nr:hypothetical protein [Bryobacterales bacterium]